MYEYPQVECRSAQFSGRPNKDDFSSVAFQSNCKELLTKNLEQLLCLRKLSCLRFDSERTS